MTNWALIIFGLAALSNAIALVGSCGITVPGTIVVDQNNPVSICIETNVTAPVQVKFELKVSSSHLQKTLTCNPGSTCTATFRPPPFFPTGPGEVTVTGTGGWTFTQKFNVNVVNARFNLLVQTSASTYRPSDIMEIRVIGLDEKYIVLDDQSVDIEIYDAAMKLVSEFPNTPLRSGLTETLRVPIAEHPNLGTWMVSATIANETSSVEVLVSRPVTPSFDLKGIFQRFLLRTDKNLQGAIEIANDENTPIFGRAIIAIGQMTEQDLSSKMEQQSKDDEWRQWKSQQMEIAGRVELNYDLKSIFNIDLNKALAIQIYIQVTDLASGQDRIIRQIIPVFNREIIYDIRPLQFEVGTNNEYEVIAKRLDGKPIKMEDMIVTVRMMLDNEKEDKIVEIKDFYTRGRNDIGFFNIEYPENCIGVHMTITPLDESGKVCGYRTRSMALLPRPHRRGAKLSIELLPSKINSANTPVVSSQIATVGDQANFYIQVLPSKSVTKFERLPLSYIVMTNGLMTSTGEFHIEPTKECQNKAVRSIRPEEPSAPTCVFNGTLSFEIKQEMMPYSTLVVYSFGQESLEIILAESYRFSVANLFENPLTLNATIVPYKPTETVIEPSSFLKDMDLKPIRLSEKVQDKTRVELSFTGEPDSIVGINVFEADGILQGLCNEMTKERLLQYLTQYEQLPLASFPMKTNKRQINEESTDTNGGDYNKRTVSEKDEEQQIMGEQKGYQMRYPIEKIIFGLNARNSLPSLEGDDVYTVSTLGKFYGDAKTTSPLPASLHRRKFPNSLNQYDVTVDNNDFIIATSMPLVFTANPPAKTSSNSKEDEQPVEKYGTAAWYEKMNKEINSIPQELLIFMQLGLNVLPDRKSFMSSLEYHLKHRDEYFPEHDQSSFSLRDRARQYLEEYISKSNLSMIVPPIMLEEQARIGYYRSIFFNTSRIGPQGTGKVVLPPMKPYSTWLASAFAVKSGSSLAIAQPIRLPTSQGLYLLANFPRQIQTGERVLLSYGINNYLGKDLSNIIVRIRASNDFDLIEQNKPEQIVSNKDKDYTVTISSMKSMAVETRHMIVVPKRSGLLQIVMEVESQFGGDSEILTFYVRESDIQRREISARLFDLTTDKKTYGPFITKVQQSPVLRSVQLAVSGTGLDRLVKRYTMETNSLIGIDRALVRLYRSLGLRGYLNETSQTNSPLFNMTSENITTAYQRLQLYQDYDGSYSFISDEGTKYSSLYLTSFAFGAMISPMMPFRDNVTLNRTLEWILSHQQEDGSFDDQSPCFHDRFCTGKFRRESLTAIVLYCLTRDNATEFYPEFISERLFKGEKSPLYRAQRYLISRVPDVKPDLMTISLFEMAFIQNRTLPSELREKIYQALISRKLTPVPEDSSKYIKNTDETMAIDDQLLLNAMTISLYAYFKDYRTTFDIARWLVSHVEAHPHYDTILDAVFRTNAWLNVDCLFRKQFVNEKFEVMIDVSADNGEKRQFKIDSTNFDLTQMMSFTLPVNQITYSIRGFGLASVFIARTYAEPKQQIQDETLFELTNEFVPMPWFSEVKCKACMTYKPSNPMPDKANRTIVLEYSIPSGTRVNVRQIGFYLSRIPQVMYFTFEPCGNKLIFFVNVPSTMFGKSICLEWMLERLSTVMTWSPIQLRLYDYLEPEIEMIERFPVQFQPNYLGYSFVEAIEKARMNLPSFKLNQV